MTGEGADEDAGVGPPEADRTVVAAARELAQVAGVRDRGGLVAVAGEGTDKLAVRSAGRSYAPANGSATIPVSVKSRQAGDATYFVDVYCAA